MFHLLILLSKQVCNHFNSSFSDVPQRDQKMHSKLVLPQSWGESIQLEICLLTLGSRCAQVHRTLRCSGDRVDRGLS